MLKSFRSMICNKIKLKIVGETTVDETNTNLNKKLDNVLKEFVVLNRKLLAKNQFDVP